MKTSTLKTIAIFWSLTFFAFWIGSGFKWVTDWREELRYTMLAIMIFALAAIQIEDAQNGNIKKL